MTLQEQICTLKQAKRLKELGCEQDKSTFYWFDNSPYYRNDNIHTDDDRCSDAYNVAELGEMLYKIVGFGWLPQISYQAWEYQIGREGDEYGSNIYAFSPPKPKQEQHYSFTF